MPGLVLVLVLVLVGSVRGRGYYTALPLATATAWSVGRSCAVTSSHTTPPQHPTAQQHHVSATTLTPPLHYFGSEDEDTFV